VRVHAAALTREIVIDHTAGPWDARVEPVDLVFDTAGGERFAGSPGVLRGGGRLVSVAEEPPQVTSISSVYFVVEPNRRQLSQIAGLLDGGWPPPAIDSVYTLEDAASAFERSMAADKRGKLVLEVARGPRRLDGRPH
jgi:NADPH:quinone reductase-like Zn-dependent oxidoreductase